MASFSLGCYTVRVIDKGTAENLPLGGFVRGSDLMTVFHQYLQARVADYSIDHERQKLWRVLRPHATDSTINGIVETGEYGYTADLYNVDTETVSYQRIGTDAEMMPFYFLTHLPANRNEGVILIQRRSNLGIRTIFLEDFADHFAESYPGFKVEFNPLVPQQLINEYLQNGRLTKIRFIRFGLPSDLSDAYDAGGHVEAEGTAEMVFSPRRGQSIPLLSRLREVFDGRREMQEMIELRGYEYDNVKVELDVRGSKKTLDLSDLLKIRAYVDITSDIRIEDDGHPEFNSIDAVARDLMGSLLAQLGTGRRDAG